MKISPLKSYKAPSYPTRQEAKSDPDLLKNNFPLRWLNGKLVIGALATYLLCTIESDTSAKIGVKTEIIPDSKNKDGNPQKENNISDTPFYIAPVFQHGDGQGAFGCIVVNPPSYLSEEDARYIIEEELKKEGIVFDKKNVRIDEIVFSPQPEDDLTESDEDSDNRGKNKSQINFLKRHDKKEAIPLIIDGYSTRFKLAYEFVSSNEYHMLCGSTNISSLESVNTIEASENLREILKTYGKLNTVVFYDPLCYPVEKEPYKRHRYKENYDPYDLQKIENEIKQKDDLYDNEKTSEREDDLIIFNERSISNSREMLRKQVRDFVLWIKEQGYLNNK